MEETVEHLFRHVEEKIIGLEMLLKHGKGQSKNYDQQLFKKVDFYVIDYEIYKHNSEALKAHIGYLIDKYYALSNNDFKLTKLASLDEDGLEFSTLSIVAANLKNDLKNIIDKLVDYREIATKRQDATIENSEALRLRATFVENLINLEINEVPVFENDDEEIRLQIMDSLVQFITKNIDKINPIVNLRTPNRKEYFAYYIVCRMAELSGIPYVSIKNIAINGEPYNEEKASRHRSKYRKNINEGDITQEFEEFYYSFEEAIKAHLA